MFGTKRAATEHTGSAEASGSSQPTRRNASPGKVGVSDAADRATLEYSGITPESLGLLAAWAPEIDDAIEEIADAFYVALTGSDVNSILVEHSSVPQQRPILVAYVRSLFTGVVDDDYMAGRRRIGMTHDRVGLPVSRYFGQYRIITGGVAAKLLECEAPADEVADVVNALWALITLDMTLSTDAFISARESKLADMDALTSSAQAVTSASADLAASSEEALASAEVIGSQADELAGSAERLAVESAQMSENARNGSETLAAAAAEAEATLRSLGEVDAQVTSLSEHAAKIQDIVKLISGITDQTSLLALNAAIEAARAGMPARASPSSPPR